MTRITLTREPVIDNITYGVLVTPSDTYQTLELPWRDNLHNQSCIPHGNYRLVPHQSPEFGRCCEIADVPGRSAILTHVGNWGRNTDGCILIGLSRGILDSEPAVLNSGLAFKRFGQWFDAQTDEVWIDIGGDDY